MSTKEWGNITWKFFHTLAEQINESKFPEVRDKLVNIVTTTCEHLPCPDCSEHATRILKKAYIKNIRTKKHFIEFLRQFHNIVNIKLSKKTYNNEEIKDMYNKNNLTQIIYQLISIYSKPTNNSKMMQK